MNRLLACWNESGDAMWGGATAVVVGTGVNKEDDLRYLKSVALGTWLFGYELPDTLVLLTKTELHIVASSKKGVCATERARFCPCMSLARALVAQRERGGSLTKLDQTPTCRLST